MFPITSISGNRYVNIMFDCDTNFIREVAIKSVETDYLIAEYENFLETLAKILFTRKYINMYNETSQKSAAEIEKKTNIKIEYVAPYYHRSLIE